MAYKRKTLDKTLPAAAGKVLFRQPEYLVFWRYTTRKPPKPKTWARLIVFMAEPTLRKRSYPLDWNGKRFAQGPVWEQLGAKHPKVLADAATRLAAFNDRLVKPLKEEDDE